MNIKEIHDKQEKREISERILKSLPNWFGIPESTQEYINKSSNLPFFAAMDEIKPLGFISIKENNQYTTEIYVMGVLPDYHKQGIGRDLFNRALSFTKDHGYEFLQVKTLDESHPDIYCTDTRKFYLSMGFKPLECLPELWGEENPCLIMIQCIR
ncbi:GNAT family N-acetyltransferase [Anaerosalibacter bizertensis]|uniref:GNAT family N-acetyltransferase n=1 Tax=Anaerosalibacter bizertensis TaxID=932217 RepID=UPI00351651D2